LKSDAIKLELESGLEELDSRERHNLISYYIDAHREKIQAAQLSRNQLRSDLAKIKEGFPIQYVTRTSFFYGHKLYVDEAVLIPRPETEELVHWIIKDHKGQSTRRILDMGVGSGCILLSLLSKMKGSVGYGADVSEDALEVFAENAKKLEVSALPVHYDMDDGDPADLPHHLDILVSNPPYILRKEKAEMDRSVLAHEPEVALFVEEDDPLHYYEKILDLAPRLIRAGGKLYFETSYRYHEELEAMVSGTGLHYEFKKDMAGQWRMLRVAF